MVKQVLVILCWCAASLWLGAARGGEFAVKSGAKIAFLGDAITAKGWERADGYVRLVVTGLVANGCTITPIPAGGGAGHQSDQMLERLDRDVLSKKPDWMTVSCGVFDVSNTKGGVPLDRFQKNLTRIVDQAQAAGVKVMLLTATMIGEDPGNEANQKLAAYNDFLHQLAADKKCLLADLNADMQAAVKQAQAALPPEAGRPAPNVLTADGVSMNAAGSMMMARGVLRAFGLGEAELQRANEAWKDLPGTVLVGSRVPLTWRQMEQLNALATRQKRTAADLINAEFARTVAELVKIAQADAAPVTVAPPPAVIVPEVGK